MESFVNTMQEFIVFSFSWKDKIIEICSEVQVPPLWYVIILVRVTEDILTFRKVSSKIYKSVTFELFYSRDFSMWTILNERAIIKDDFHD